MYKVLVQSGRKFHSYGEICDNSLFGTMHVIIAIVTSHYLDLFI